MCGRTIHGLARGRRDYGHPVQLAAMVHAGLTTVASATWDTSPVAVPRDLEPLLLAADPTEGLDAASRLDWNAPPKYYMFDRRIKNWSRLRDVQADLQTFKV